MDFITFKIRYAETMLYYQRIENDIKYIYAYMKKGNIYKHFDEIDNKTLGQMIRKLKCLDYSDNKPLISLDDYNFLTQICDNRNHWAHAVFTKFIYIEDFLSSTEYKKQSLKLEKDHQRVESASNILENIRINYCTSVRK